MRKTLISAISLADASVISVSTIGNYISGLFLVLMLPSLLGLGVIGLMKSADPNPSFLGGRGPICELRERQEAASPNGRFIAISVQVLCEDEDYNKRESINQIYVKTTRWMHAAHIFSMTHDKSFPSTIRWTDNRTIELQKNHANVVIYSRPWCDISIDLKSD